MLYASLLTDRAVLALSGAEARDFLQGLITNDMAGCAQGRAIYAALLTPQGKILFDFFVVPEGENRFLMDCAAARAGDLTKRLMLYRLRTKVEIAARPDLGVAAIWGEGAQAQAPAGAVMFADPRHAALGLRLIGGREALAITTGKFTQGDYDAHRLVLGVPDSADLPPDQVFALDAGMEELNGVSFKKGCYVGQEVTARMKHRATARRRFMMAEIAGDLPAPGTSVQAEGRELGTLATGKEGRAVALVRLDRLAEAQEKHAPITVAGLAATLKKPDWFHG
jgi:folate-binding protein YgfZ